MDDVKALEVIQGCLLSDGSLVKPNAGGLARFSMDLSGSDHIDWLFLIKDALTVLGIPVSDTYPKVAERTSRGKPYTECFLQSRMNTLLLEMYLEWYDGGMKRIPANLFLTPIVIANWFMGDGSSSYHTNGVLTAKFATNSYSVEDVLRLANMLMDYGVAARINRDGLSGYYMTTSARSSVTRLMELVKPHMVPSYSYKVKEVHGNVGR